MGSSPLEFGPELAMARMPAPVKRSSGWISSSLTDDDHDETANQRSFVTPSIVIGQKRAKIRTDGSRRTGRNRERAYKVWP